MKDYATGLIALLVGVCALALAACGPENSNARVQIEYVQVKNFSRYQLAPGVSNVEAGEGMFILYKVKKITNTGSSAKPFTFLTEKVAAVAPDKTSNKQPPDDVALLSGVNANGAVVKPGESISNPGCFLKWVQTSNPELLGFHPVVVVLLHQIDDPSQPVTMTLADKTTAALKELVKPTNISFMCTHG